VIHAELQPGDEQRRRRIALGALLAGIAATGMAGMLAGAADVTAADVWAMIESRLGAATSTGDLSESILWSIRLPRVLTGAVVGSALGVAGCALQGVFRNQMAAPQLLGISATAGLGAVAGLAVTSAGGSVWPTTLGAAIAGVVAAGAIRRLADRIGEGSQLMLAGLAIGLSALAWLGAVVLVWDSPRVPTFTFWVFGSLAGSTWNALVAGTTLIAIGIGLAVVRANQLDVMALGLDAARHSGIATDSVERQVLLGVGAATGASVALAGVIGFVGLVVPLLLRSFVGPAHRWLIPLSALGGAVAVVAADTIARTAAAPAEIPVGLLTAAFGGPIFVWLAVRTGRWTP